MAGPSGRTPIGDYPYPIPDDTVDYPRDMEALARAIDPNAVAVIIGEIRTFGLAVAPERWVACDGTTLEQADYPELYDALGSLWVTGGESPTQFRVPDLRGRAIVGAGAGSGLTARDVAEQWGEEAHTLKTTEIPSHSHSGVTGVDSPDHVHYMSAYTGTETADHAHSGTTYGDYPDHAHGVNVTNLGQGNAAVLLYKSGLGVGAWTAPGVGTSYFGTGGATARHQHDFATGGRSAAHQHLLQANSGGASARHAHGIPPEGGGGSHNIAQPSIALLVCIYAGR